MKLGHVVSMDTFPLEQLCWVHYDNCQAHLSPIFYPITATASMTSELPTKLPQSQNRHNHRNSNDHIFFFASALVK